MKPTTMLLLGLSLLLAACSSHHSTQEVAQCLAEAHQEVACGEADHAKALCDDLLQNAELDASQLADLSILYMQLSDRDDMEDNTAIAYQCYRNAFKADSVQAAEYYLTVTGDNVRYAQMLAVLAAQMDNPDKNNIGDHESEDADSLHISH